VRCKLTDKLKFDWQVRYRAGQGKNDYRRTVHALTLAARQKKFVKYAQKCCNYFVYVVYF